jgi:hypothetical protein
MLTFSSLAITPYLLKEIGSRHPKIRSEACLLMGWKTLTCTPKGDLHCRLHTSSGFRIQPTFQSFHLVDFKQMVDCGGCIPVSPIARKNRQ